MLQVFFEIIVAVLAVYGVYTALHEVAALICKWIGTSADEHGEEPPEKRKEDSADGRNGRSDHAGRDD